MVSILKHLLQSVGKGTAPHIQSGPFDIKLIGDDGFVGVVRSALALLQRTCPDYYQEVLNHVAVIESANEGASRLHEEPPRITLASSIGYGRDLPLQSRVVWYAGAIVHEAWHSKLYREYRLENPCTPWPTDATSTLQREDACLQAQHDALLRMGAPPWMLDYVKSRMGLGPQEAGHRLW